MIRESRNDSDREFSVALAVLSDQAGGGEEYLYRLYRDLVGRGIANVTLVGALPSWPEDLGPTINVGYATKFTRRINPAVQAARSLLPALRMLRECRRSKYDVVHVQYFREKLLLPRLVGKPVVWTEHGPLPTNLPRPLLAFLRWQARGARVVAVSLGVQESLAAVGIKSTVVANPLPPTMRGSLSAPPSGRKTVLFAGRLHPAKRVDLLIGAARNLPEVEFVVAGTGPAEDELRSAAPENVAFAGHVHDVQALMATSSMLVIPSGLEAREGSPLAMLEARSLGLPVLMAMDCHAFAESLTLGCHGFAPSVDALTAAIRAERGQPNPLSPIVRDERAESRWADLHADILRSGATGR